MPVGRQREGQLTTRDLISLGLQMRQIKQQEKEWEERQADVSLQRKLLEERIADIPLERRMREEQLASSVSARGLAAEEAARKQQKDELEAEARRAAGAFAEASLPQPKMDEMADPTTAIESPEEQGSLFQKIQKDFNQQREKRTATVDLFKSGAAQGLLGTEGVRKLFQTEEDKTGFDLMDFLQKGHKLYEREVLPNGQIQWLIRDPLLAKTLNIPTILEGDKIPDYLNAQLQKNAMNEQSVALNWLVQNGTPAQSRSANEILKRKETGLPAVVETQSVDPATGQPITLWTPSSLITSGQIGAIPSATLKPLPTAAVTSLEGNLQSLYYANQMLPLIKKGGTEGFAGLTNWMKVFGASMGVPVSDASLINFEAAKRQLVVLGQSVTKGIPSNWDIQNYMKTIAQLMQSKTLNEQLIIQLKDLAEFSIKMQIATYRGTGHMIPPQVVNTAKSFGIDVAKIDPTDWGTVDPTNGYIIHANLSKENAPEWLKPAIQKGDVNTYKQNKLKTTLQDLGYDMSDN